MKTLFITLLLSLSCSISFADSTNKSQENSSLLQGKPFIKLQTSIDELQSKISDIVGNVDTIEERMVALTVGVDKARENSNNLQVQLESLSMDKQNNSDEINNIMTLLTENSRLIFEMQKEIDSAQKVLETKQDILAGTCPEGTSLESFDGKGELVCSSDNAEVGFKKITVSKTGTLHKNIYRCCSWWSCRWCVAHSMTRSISLDATCPKETILVDGSSSISGSYASITSSSMTGNTDQPGQTWKTNAYGSFARYSNTTVVSNATCISFNK